MEFSRLLSTTIVLFMCILLVYISLLLIRIAKELKILRKELRENQSAMRQIFLRTTADILESLKESKSTRPGKN